MAQRKGARTAFYEITSHILEFLGDPFRHVEDVSKTNGHRAEIIAFGRDYEELVELLRDAQQYGPTIGGDRRYQKLRTPLSLRYQDLRPFLVAFLRFDVEDEKVGLARFGMGTDAFQATWWADSIYDFVELEDAFFEDRISRAQDALKYYNDHLHYLGEAA